MPLDEPEGWRWLWERAQQEKDPKKLTELIDQLNQLLSVHEKATAAFVRPAKILKRNARTE